MRSQYHFRRRGEHVLIWDVRKLVALSAALPREDVPLERIAELDERYWFSEEGSEPTCRAVLTHARLINEADLSFPVVLSAAGRVMDGMHRVAKAVLEGRRTIIAVRFDVDPEPDFIDRKAADLPY